MKSGWLMPLAVLAVIVLFGAFAAKPMQTASDIAAWVQGVGSLAAVAAAVWIYARQQAEKKADELAETVAFVLSIREEIQSTWTGYSADMRKRLHKTPDGQHFEHLYPVSSDAFTIYNASPSMVGKIHDAELRRLIVVVYAEAKGLVSTFQLNNQLLPAYREALAHGVGGPTGQSLRGMADDELTATARKLKARDKTLSRDVYALLERAELWLQSVDG